MTAAQIQSSFLPQAMPSVPGYSFWATIERCAVAAGGDLYDFQTLPTGEISVLVSDVSGKGVSASVLMAALAGIVTVAIEAFGADLVGMMTVINRAYSRRMLSDGFATLMAVALDPLMHQIRAVNAGHGPALIRRRDGSIEQLAEESGLPLGVFEDAEYVTVIAGLAPGDAVFIATDGVNEAMNAEAGLYGATRLSEVLARTKGEAADFGQAVLADIKTFIGGRPLMDDTTTVCFSRNAVE